MFAESFYLIQKSVEAEKHGVSETFRESGNHGGNIGTNSDRYAEFVKQLRAAGFNGQQLKQINNALRECGLEVVAVESVSG